eukprot:1314278-Rhodomonas_salina.3
MLGVCGCAGPGRSICNSSSSSASSSRSCSSSFRLDGRMTRGAHSSTRASIESTILPSARVL